MENNALPHLKPIRALTKVASYTEDQVRINEVRDSKVPEVVNPSNECDEHSSVNHRSMQCELTLTEKFKMRGNKRFILAYPFNCKPSGVWIPTNFVKN